MNFKIIILGLTLGLLINTAFAGSISGKITLIKSDKTQAPKGVLYIFARKYNSKMRMPLAVKRIENPKYPVNFTLSEADAMIKSIPFKGPFQVVARVSPSGSATDKTGIEVSTTSPVELGAKAIKLELKL